MTGTSERDNRLARIVAIGTPYARRTDRITLRFIEEEPAPNTVRWWGLQKGWPAWLVEAMAVQRYPNQELTEQEVIDLALATGEAPLGPYQRKTE